MCCGHCRMKCRCISFFLFYFCGFAADGTPCADWRSCGPPRWLWLSFTVRSREHSLWIDFGSCSTSHVFLPGMIAFVLPHTPRLKSFLWLPFILIQVCIFAIFPFIQTGWVLCLLLGLAIPFFGEIKTSWLRWTSHHIATYSYGIYLSHQFCIWLVADILGGWSAWIKFPALAIMLIGIPIVLYHTIEKPMIGLGVRVAEIWSSKGLAAAQSA